MRLTLRTLLAYMDDILDPADHEELGKKIEASDFAAELIHRSRDTVRRLRLGAPEVFAGEDDDVLNPDPASDANTVAEYLDNTLPPEQVAEFERVCLETGTAADMHLAEVTSCHHVLTMVLGEPAEIDPQVRRRMYELPQHVEASDKLRIESAHVPITITSPDAPATSVAAVPPQPAAKATPATSPAPVVLPDYLRVAAERRRRTQRWATAAVLIVLGGLTVYVISGAFEEPKTPAHVSAAMPDEDVALEDVQIGGPTTEQSAQPGTSGETARTETSQTTAPLFDDAAPPTEEATAQEQTAEAEHGEAGAETADQLPAETIREQPSVARSAEPVAGSAPVAVDNAAEEQPATTTKAPEEMLTEASPPEDQAVGSVAGAESPNARALEGMPLPPQDQATTDPTEQLEPETTATIEGDLLGIEGTDATAEAAEDTPPEPAGPQQVGVYMGNNDVLLRYVADNGQWLRLPPRTTIIAGDTLLALPKFRTHVVLRSVNSYLSGGTQISVPEQDETNDSKLALEMEYGRLLLNAGLRGSDLTLKIGEQTREFQLDNSASLAVDVHRIFVPGTDYETQAAPVEVEWYLTGGSLHRVNPDGVRETIKAPAAWKSLNEADEPPQNVSEVPGWIDREPMTELERRARDRFAEELPIGQPVSLRLEELNSEEGAGREIRTLSAASSLYVGEFEPFVKSLNDSDQRVAWRSHIAAVRQALAMDSNAAAKLREAFINVRGSEDGEVLFAMVKGFTPEQIGTTREELQQGVLIELIRALEYDSLDYRVLGIYNLDEIKGTRELAGYRPDGIPRTRAIAVAKIREMIENNEFLNLP